MRRNVLKATSTEVEWKTLRGFGQSSARLGLQFSLYNDSVGFDFVQHFKFWSCTLRWSLKSLIEPFLVLWMFFFIWFFDISVIFNIIAFLALSLLFYSLVQKMSLTLSLVRFCLLLGRHDSALNPVSSPSPICILPPPPCRQNNLGAKRWGWKYKTTNTNQRTKSATEICLHIEGPWLLRWHRPSAWQQWWVHKCHIGRPCFAGVVHYLRCCYGRGLDHRFFIA